MKDKARKGRKVAKAAEAGRGGKLRRKDYDKELARLHVELVKLKRWVQATGTKVCVVFQGRDGAGKGGTIKAITEREKVKLPKRQKPHGYLEPKYPFKYVEERF